MSAHASRTHRAPLTAPGPRLVVRPVRPAEHRTVAALRERAYAHELGERLREGYRAELRDVARHVAVADVLVAVDAEDRPVGTVTFIAEHDHPLSEHADPEAASFRFLAVDPDQQGRGAAQMLVRACVERAREQGVARLVLHVLADNVRAARLYAHLGFARAGDLDWEPFPGLVLEGWRLPLR